MRRLLKDILLLIFFTVFFLGILLFIESFFSVKRIETKDIETNYIEKSHSDIDLNSVNKEEKQRSEILLAQELKKKIEQDKKIQAFIQEQRKKALLVPPKQVEKRYNFVFLPETIRWWIGEKTDSIRLFLETDFVNSFLWSLNVKYYQKMFDVRWKMKDSSVLLFWVEDLSSKEILSVFIHEFGHYVDIYFLDDWVSDFRKTENFYHLSWESTKVLLAGQWQKDFVSGYAMTNKYEDFAESFDYYILHNEDFKKKAENSSILKKKYDFFETTLFSQNQFEWTNFSTDDTVLDYYRDVTKIDFDMTNFLQYLEK